MTTGAPLLMGQAVTRRFGGLIAVNAVDIEVREGEIFGLIGPNGAGKTTLFRLLAGIYRPSSGSITLRGTEIGGRSAHSVNAMGIATTHQIVRPFPEMPVEKNVLVGLLYGRSKLRGRAADAEVHRILELTELVPHRDTLGRSLTLASGSRSHGRSRRGRTCSSSTRSPRGSIRRRAPAWWTSSGGCATRASRS